MLANYLVIATLCISFGATADAATGTPATIEVTSPREGDTWGAGSRHVVTWRTDRVPDGASFTFAFSTDDGKTWAEMAGEVTGPGAFSWGVPEGVSTTCRIRVTAPGLAPAVSGRFAVGPTREVHDYRWVKVTDRAAFAPRDGAGALVFRGRMWLLGGWNPQDPTHFPRICNNEVWSSADGATWSLVKPNTFLDRRFDASADWEGRHTAGYVVFRDRMWIVGGDVNQGHYQSDVWSSPDGRAWDRVSRDTPVPWGPRALHYTLAFRDRIWVMGGQTMPGFAPSREAFYRDIWSTADGVRWERVAPEEPYWSARGMIGGGVVHKGRMWILGGGTYDTPTTPARRFYNDVWSSPDGVRWERHVEHAPWAARQYHDVATFDDRMWVLEGYSGANRNDVWYSEDGANWYELPGTPWSPRHAASVFVFDNALWVVAGNNMQPDAWKLVRGRTLNSSTSTAALREVGE
jgi:hypothetical protein